MTEKALVKENPIFRVTNPPGFATGLVMHPPGTEIEWVVPDDWDEKKYGKHYAAYGPSLTFQPMNAAAEALMEDHKALVKKKNTPKTAVDDERFAKLEAMHLQIMNSMLEQQAENRRLREQLGEAGNKKKGKQD